MEDPPPPSSPSLGQSQPSQSQNPGDAKQSDESIGAEHTPKNVPSHMEAQSGVGMQSQTSQDNSPPCQSSVAPNPLWDKALESAPGHLSSEHPIASDSLRLPSSQAPAHLSSEDTIASDSLRLPSSQAPAHLTPEQPITSDTLILPSSQAPAHLTPEQPITSDTLILPSSSGPSAIQEGRKLSHQYAIRGLTGSEPEESDSTEQETSDDDDAHSVLTYFSSTSTSTQTQVNREQSLSSHHSQPPTAYPTSPPSVPSPSEVASVIKSSGETGQAAATAVEVAASVKKWQDSGYSGSNQFNETSDDDDAVSVLTYFSSAATSDDDDAGSVLTHFSSTATSDDDEPILGQDLEGI